MADTNDRIVKILEGMDKRFDGIEQSQERTETALDAVKAGLDDVRATVEMTGERLSAEIRAARAEAKVDNLHLQSKIDKALKNHEHWLEAIGEKTGITDPTKN